MNTFAARNYKFGPGDIVVYVSPKDPTDCLIKRVIGLEGDIISSDRYSTEFVHNFNRIYVINKKANQVAGLNIFLFSGTRCLTCWCLKAASGLRVIIGETLSTGDFHVDVGFYDSKQKCLHEGHNFGDLAVFLICGMIHALD